MATRKTTNDELVEHLRTYIQYGRPVRFRHFVREMMDRRTVNGVRHKQYSNAKVHMIDGVPHVRHHGEMEPLTATWQDCDASGHRYNRPVIWDVRLDSPHLN